MRPFIALSTLIKWRAAIFTSSCAAKKNVRSIMLVVENAEARLWIEDPLANA